MEERDCGYSDVFFITISILEVFVFMLTHTWYLFFLSNYGFHNVFFFRLYEAEGQRTK